MSSERIQRILKSVDDKVRTLIKPDRFYVALYDELRSKLEFPWVVENGEHNWDDRPFDEKKAPDWLIKQYLFSVDRAFQDSLKKGELSPDFRQEFTNHNITLPSKPTIKTLEEDSEWEVIDSDKKKVYIVKKEDERLNIYIKQKTPCLLEPDVLEPDVAMQMTGLGVEYWPDGEIPKSWLGVPMVFEDRVLGVLVAESHTWGAFGERGKRVLSTIAGQTAGAIETARLYERLNRRIKDLDAVNEIGQKLNSQIQLSETEILKRIHEEAKKLIHTDNMYIALFDETRDEIRFPLMFVGGKVHKVLARQFNHDDMGKTEEIIKTKKPLFHATKAESLGWYGQRGHKEHIGKPFASWIGVPMIVRDKVIGVIAAYHDTLDYIYEGTDLQILSSMASQAAIAIDNAKLVKELEYAQSKIAETESVLTRTSIAADFVHRMNNLAGTIPVWVDLIRERLGAINLSDSKLEKYLDNIAEEADGLLREAERLQSIPQMEAVDIEAVLQSLVRQAFVQVPAEIDVKLNCEEFLPGIHAVRTDLVNAFWNIIENGIEAMHQEGQLTIDASISEDKEWIEIAIKDQGKGIPEKEMDVVFVPFISTRTGHMGYGLWRAKHVFERLGGNIDFKTEEEIGTTFFVRLPVSRNDEDEK